jgi:hypothetical protein
VASMACESPTRAAGVDPGRTVRNCGLDPAPEVARRRAPPRAPPGIRRNECFAKTVADTPSYWIDPSEGGDRSMSRSSEGSNSKAPRCFRDSQWLHGPTAATCELLLAGMTQRVGVRWRRSMITLICLWNKEVS